MVCHMRCVAVSVSVLALGTVAAADATSSAERVSAGVPVHAPIGAGARAAYTGYVTVLGGAGPTHSGSQGDGWTLVLVRSQRGAVRYRACAQWLAGSARRCWSATATQNRKSRIGVALFVNDSGGPGPWLVTWRVGARQVASWRFTVTSEGV
jgi:hypothetical protein